MSEQGLPSQNFTGVAPQKIPEPLHGVLLYLYLASNLVHINHWFMVIYC
jgi:hypothetical protein